MPQRPVFVPDEVAFCETAGWAACYNRDWPRVLWLMVRLNRSQFGMSWAEAVMVALDTVRAAAAFAPAANDLAGTRRYLARYFERARRAAGINAPAAALARVDVAADWAQIVYSRSTRRMPISTGGR